MIAASVSGLAIAALAVPLAGGGHGWTGALWSAAAVVTAPLGALAWRYRDLAVGRTIAMAVIAVDLVVDVVMAASLSHRFPSALWEALKPIAIAWAALWIFWQIPPALAALPRQNAG